MALSHAEVLALLPEGYRVVLRDQVNTCATYSLLTSSASNAGEMILCDGSAHSHPHLSTDFPLVPLLPFLYLHIVATEVRSLTYTQLVAGRRAFVLTTVAHMLLAHGWIEGQPLQHPLASGRFFERAGSQCIVSVAGGDVLVIEMPKR